MTTDGKARASTDVGLHDPPIPAKHRRGAGPVSKTVLLEQAYQDFCQRRGDGEALDPDDYCAGFPNMKSSLQQLLQAHLFLEEHLALVGEDPEVVRWPEPGETFLGYELKLELGKGAFARVFLATEPKLGNRLVAVKIAPSGAAEADVLGRIQHRNIVPVHSVHEDTLTGMTAVCMPYVGSATLCDVLDRAFPAPDSRPTRASIILEVARELPHALDPGQPAPPDPILQDGAYLDAIRHLGARLADALAFIHDRGIYHRDLKPSNVLLSPEGVPMLLDFNLCADARQASNRLGGTFQYMSPEQLQAMDKKDAAAAKAIDGRSDLFSLGVILYQLVTGAHPFGPIPLRLTEDETLQLLLNRHRHAPAEARQLNPNVDADLSRLIQRCLAYDPKARPQSAAEIAMALRPAVARRRRWPWALAAALLLAMSGVGLGSLALAPANVPRQERPLDVGLRLYREGDYPQAVERLSEALQAEPHNTAARFARARAHQRLGEADRAHFNLAMDDYRAVDEARPDGRAKAGLAYCESRTGVDPRAVIEHLGEAITAKYETAAVRNNLGYSCLKTKNGLQKAKDHLDRAIELDDKLPAAYHNRALVALGKALLPGTKDEQVLLSAKAGIADADKALALGTASAELHYDAACLCAVAARFEPQWTKAAIDHLDAAVRQGCDPKKCNHTFFDGLRNEPAYQALFKRSFAGQPLPPTGRLVDPITDDIR
jgi:serine/threonine protein kinase/Tfp pilus assembly protein PilF